jgi:methanogenic corrinoid protein MtbC1
LEAVRMIDLQEISEALILGKAKKVKDLIDQALKEGVDPIEILNKALIPGMNVVGEKFKKCEYFIPEVLIAARAMNAGMRSYKAITHSDRGRIRR